MEFEMLPVDGTLTPSGAIASLARLMPEPDAHPIPLAANEDPFANFEVALRQVSVSVAAKLNIASIFNTSGSGSRQGFYFDAIAFRDKMRLEATPSRNLIGTRYGVGLRVSLLARDAKVSLGGGFGVLAAAVECNAASVEYQIRGFGLGLDGFAIVLSNMSATGTLDYKTYLDIQNKIVPALSEWILKNKVSLTPEIIAVALRRPPELIQDSQSVYYAMTRIKERVSLNDAIRRAPPSIDPDILTSTYALVIGQVSSTTAPTAEDRSQASSWLNFSSPL
jgi:hypothetical protein